MDGLDGDFTMISLLQLEYFCVLAEVGHMSKAAEKLYISQSTRSTMITKLEKELGVSLFDRKNTAFCRFVPLSHRNFLSFGRKT